MPFRHHPALRCPLDGLPMEWDSHSLRCPNKHSFDRARQGYCNLLSAQDKRSKDPGDSQPMIAARHRFLEAGHYYPVAEGIAQLLLPYVDSSRLVVDAGCGEGYYLNHLRDCVQAAGLSEPGILGFDISKWALQVAARRFPGTWLVASNRNIPLEDASADLVMDMFGFPDFPSFSRVLKSSGLLLRVQTGHEHLRELRELIYPQLKAQRPASDIPKGFTLRERAALTFKTADLDQEVIADLLLMTPHFFRASAEGRARVAAVSSLAVTVDVSLTLLQRD
ncbi:putative RNA methyltransferase [Congregibacter litoralis]|uniref:Methyltransferase n=1 Tax=Congregibacter litoralis KT71 TaxID=314285 RepID=A4AAU4_9GAMM|nr:methyltransferase domain-containing protein [Congregibacter litoralis]EAQ96816.1 methyltransferase [Congregibacter litoralis KT71]